MGNFFLTVMLVIFAAFVVNADSVLKYPEERSIQEQQKYVIDLVVKTNNLEPDQIKSLEEIVYGSSRMGQGTPGITFHPASREECSSMLAQNNINYRNAHYEAICGTPYMSPVYNPKFETAKDAKVCIDQFEFPNVPCEYPVTWVTAREAALICEAIGKRLCDAVEWEDSCAGGQEGVKFWAYGPVRDDSKCALNSRKTPGCNASEYDKCGTNTYPAGYFPECKSAFDVYDQHGNAAEHMILPRNENPRRDLNSEHGVTEMKGSWFVGVPHPDWCRWREPGWHRTEVMAYGSHSNYHLGFRCCKDVK